MVNKLLKTLTRNRDSLLYRLNSIDKFIEETQTSIEASGQLPQESFGLIKVRVEAAKEIYEEFKQTQSEIERECQEADLNDEFEQRALFENNYFTVTNLLSNLIIQNEQRNPSQTDELANVLIQDFSRNENIKLPIINLPKFSGSHTDWLEFKEIFESLIHNNNTINPIQKFHYLRAALIGNAAKIIQKFSLSQQNYITAWEVLCNRFSNTDLLLHSHIKAIFDLPSTNSTDAKTFRNLNDELTRNLEFLSRLGDAKQQRDAIIIFTVSNKFDKSTAREWEDFVSGGQSKSIETLETFLNSKAEILEKLDQRNSNTNTTKTNYKTDKRQTFISTGTECLFCKATNHAIYRCSEFLKLTPQERKEKIIRKRACCNCLKTGHRENDCFSGKCRVCNKSHNTLLHCDTEVSLNSIATNNYQQVLLSTVMVKVFDSRGRAHQARALLDCGSQSNYITYSLQKKLNIQKCDTVVSVTGISSATSNIKHKCSLKIHSNRSNFNAKITCLLLHNICDNIPTHTVHKSINNLIDIHNTQGNILLADPSFSEPQPIDILIGADLFWRILLDSKIDLGKNQPCLKNTEFGWIVCGGTYSNHTTSICNLSKQTNIQNQIQKFWEIEEIDQNKISTCPNDRVVEKHFVETFQRDYHGRFIVKMPFKDTPSKLGESRHTALKRFRNLELKLASNTDLRDQYSKFMQEYEILNHMRKIQHPIDDDLCYYMPHHAVLKADSITTKCRVVFDASAVTDTGISLNNILHVGPVVQQDLTSILIRFRQHAYVFSADVSKMYRQVLITPEHTKFQRILWRSNTDSEIHTYELQTVTYGTATGSFLATRCLKQLALENLQNFPQAAEVIQRDFYIDDLISGANSIVEAKILCNQISDILASGCFELKKWCANDNNILENVEQSDLLTQYINFGENSATKLLGVQWSFNDDVLSYHVSKDIAAQTITKRVILSEISKIFDPLGLLAPAVIITKIIIQQIWLLKSDWDDEVPNDLKGRWLHFKTNLAKLNSLAIPRFALCNDSSEVELHGFCDASQDAYGACIYVRSLDKFNNVHVHLLTAKSRVAPLKTLSIPRLELCGALLLAELMQKVQTSITFNANSYFWTDSQVVLSWLKNQSKLFQIFVSNRIAKIQEMSNIHSWNYTNTSQNPADLVSRGLQPDELLNCGIWWQGPSWLAQHKQEWPISTFNEIETSELPEMKKTTQVYISIDNNQGLITRYSSLTKLKRITAWCLRFIHNSKLKREAQTKLTGPLSTIEINQALQNLIKISQNIYFNKEIDLLSANKTLPLKNKLTGLTPYLDNVGILRVGGRLKHSNVSFEQRHPILLSSKCNLTHLIFSNEHTRLLHAGPQLLLYTIRQKFWVPGGRNLSRAIVRKCVICVRAKPNIQIPIMGDLPSSRVKASLPFTNTGTDFAGPFFVRERRGRGRKTYKCYICLFVCMATKAVHLETVTDLTTNSFMQLLSRFMARRGQPDNIYSDNGKTYVGANSELGKFLQINSKSLTEKASKHSISWHFIPAYSPNFGGLWEAGVKSVKHHLKRVLANASVTFEQFTSVITEIEGILNSRPLSPLSADPNDDQPLTPAHFLIGRPITAPDMMQVQGSSLSNYQYILQLKRHFWERWHKEYITELQLRTKWKTNINNIQINSLIVIKDDHAPPLQWKIGRVMELHPGADGVVRVITVKTASGLVKRAVSRVCSLPIDIANPE